MGSRGNYAHRLEFPRLVHQLDSASKGHHAFATCYGTARGSTAPAVVPLPHVMFSQDNDQRGEQVSCFPSDDTARGSTAPAVVSSSQGSRSDGGSQPRFLRPDRRQQGFQASSDDAAGGSTAPAVVPTSRDPSPDVPAGRAVQVSSLLCADGSQGVTGVSAAPAAVIPGRTKAVKNSKRWTFATLNSTSGGTGEDMLASEHLRHTDVILWQEHKYRSNATKLAADRLKKGGRTCYFTNAQLTDKGGLSGALLLPPCRTLATRLQYPSEAARLLMGAFSFDMSMAACLGA